MVFTLGVSYILVLVLRQRKIRFWNILFLSLSLFFSFSTSSFSFALFYSICLVVYQLPKSERLLLADEVSTLLSDPVTRSARLCVLGTWGTVWRWPLTLIKGSTALFGSYQFNQLAHCCSLPIHGSVAQSLPVRAHSPAHTQPGSCLLQATIHPPASYRKLPACWKGGQQIGSFLLFQSHRGQYCSWIFSGSSRWCLDCRFHVCYMLSKN